MKKQILASIFLAAIIWTVFGQTLRHDFVNYDDDAYVYDNPIIAGGFHWHAIVWVFTHSLCSNWHPVTWLSLMLDYQLHGLHPGGYHLTNVLLHTFTAILLFLWLEKFTRLRGEAAAAQAGTFWQCLFVAAVFAIHPLRVESVAWVAERKDVLSGLFFMLTLWAYSAYVRAAEGGGQRSEVRGQKSAVRGPWSLFHLPSSIFYLLSLTFFALGLMSKPMLVTVPFVLLLVDYWPLGRFTVQHLKFTPSPRLLLEKVPFLALAAASCLATVLAQEPVTAGVQDLTIPWRVENALIACVDYLGQMLYPAGLAVFYPLPAIRPSLWVVGFSALVLLLVSAGAIAGRRKHPWLLVGWLWYLGMLVPVIGLVQVGAQARADRYTYLPQIGLCVAAVWSAVEICGTRRRQRAWLGAVGAGIVAALIGVARIQTGYWKDSVTLWTHTLACTSGNWIAHENLGNALFKQKKYAGAVENYERTIGLNPNDAQAHYDLGIVLAAQGDAAQAMDQYQRALQINPGYADAHVNIGNLLAQQGRLAEAVEHYQRALQIKPDHAKAHVNLGNVLSAQGQWTEAVEHYKRALEIKPDYALACANLGNVLANHGKPAEAAPYFERAIALATAQGNLPMAEAIRNRLQSLPPAP